MARPGSSVEMPPEEETATGPSLATECEESAVWAARDSWMDAFS